MDKIVKTVYIIDKENTFYGIVMRDSGKFDLYWDMIVVDSQENGKHSVVLM